MPARTRATLLLDNAHLTNAYAVLETSGGAGGTVALTYAEALKDAKGEKGNRNEIEGKTALGVKDVFRPGGGERRRFQTLWFRTFRYVQVEIETADDPLRVHDLHGIFTAYPFQEKARFASDLPWIKDMWEMNWRVARLCAWETYFDTPYYEQLQYVGDTRIQALISLYMTGDDRLVRQAISHFDVSRIPEGITASRYPSDLGQYIPTFSLIWVAMVHDYWMHRDDPAYVRGLLPGVRGVLGWYERHLDETGLLGPMPLVELRGLGEGVAGGHSSRGEGRALRDDHAAVRLRPAARRPSWRTPSACRARGLATAPSPGKLTAAARAKAWDPARGLFLDSPEAKLVSQQTNTHGGAGGRGARRRAARAHGAGARRPHARPVHLLLQLLCARGAAEGGPRGSLHRAAGPLAGRCWPWASPPPRRARSPRGPTRTRGAPTPTTASWPRCSAFGPRARDSSRCASLPAWVP